MLTKSPPLKSKIRALYSHKVDFLFLSLLLVLSIIYYSDLLRNDVILVHGDHRYALTVNESLFQKLSNLPIHASKLPLSLILYPLQIIFSDIAAEKIFAIIALFLAATVLYIANKQIVSRFQGTRGYWLSVSCFVGSLVFIYNPWTINKVHHHYWLVISLAGSYLLIATIDSYIHSKEWKNVKQFILIGFSTSLMATQPQGAIIYFLPMLVIYLIVNLIFHRPHILSKHTAKKISIIVIITIACNLFWLVPVIQGLNTDTDRISQGSGLVFSEESEGFATYGIVHENVDQLSRRATIQNVLKGTSSWLVNQPGIDANPDASIQINNIDLWEGLAFLPLSFIVLFFFIRSPIGKGVLYIPVFFVALVILSVILATGSYYNDIYKRIFLDLPFGEAIRESYKFVGLYFVAVSFFASASLYKLDRKSLRKKIAALLLMVGLILSWGWVGLTGDLNGHLTESLLPYPHDLADVSEYLHTEYGVNSSDAKGKIFWYPTGIEQTKLKYSDVPELSTGSLPLLDVPPYMLNYINDLIKKKDTSFIPLLEYLGVHYLVIREDYVDNEDNVIGPSPVSLQDMQIRAQNLKAILHENIVFKSGSFGVYKLNNNNNNNNPMVSVSHAISSGTDDLSKVARVADESDYLNNIQLGPLLDNDSFIVMSDVLPPEPSGGAITTVNPTSEHHLPRRYWSSGAINGGWLNSITPYLNNLGINTWQFDYNTGSIFTWGEKSIPSKYNVHNAKTLTKFDFDSPDEISQWHNNRPEDQVVEHESNAKHESNAMRVVLNTYTFGWKAITSPAFDVSADQTYIVKLGMRYNNEEGVRLILTEYGKNDIMVNRIVKNIGNGTSYSWMDLAYSYTPSSKDVTSIRLSILHTNLREQPLPTVLWINSVGIYEVPNQDLVENSISFPFKVHGGGDDNNNNYKLFVRYLENPRGGLINATLEDSRPIQINTTSSHSNFVWRELGEYTLNEGTHTMTLTNEEGFNAINEILLIQKDQFEVIRGQIHDWINRNNSTAVYIFEAESDMNADNINSVGGESFSGNEITLMNTTAWTQFDVKKGGDYRIWIKGSGMFSAIVDDHKEIVNATMNRPTFSGSFPLKEGDHSRLVITPLQAPANNTGNSNFSDGVNVIDSIWLVADSNNRLHEIHDGDGGSRTSPNAVQVITTPISNNLWSPQEYEFQLNNTTSEPLIISIAEPFNPNLKATIYTKDGVTKVENLFPLFYSLRTGVYIDSPAPDTRVVIYEATPSLEWFAVASFISLASYVLLILLANVKLINGFKGLICNMTRTRKHRIS